MKMPYNGGGGGCSGSSTPPQWSLAEPRSPCDHRHQPPEEVGPAKPWGVHRLVPACDVTWSRVPLKTIPARGLRSLRRWMDREDGGFRGRARVASRSARNWRGADAPTHTDGRFPHRPWRDGLTPMREGCVWGRGWEAFAVQTRGCGSDPPGGGGGWIRRGHIGNHCTARLFGATTRSERHRRAAGPCGDCLWQEASLWGWGWALHGPGDRERRPPLCLPCFVMGSGHPSPAARPRPA